jgi:hypothetical protein
MKFTPFLLVIFSHSATINKRLNMRVIGQKDSLHFIIGDQLEFNFQAVDIWFKDVLLTRIDNMAYLPQFINSMNEELNEIKLGKINPDSFFLDLGPTTDDCSSRIYLSGDEAKVSFDLDEGVVLETKMLIAKLIELYTTVIMELKNIKA